MLDARTIKEEDLELIYSWADKRKDWARKFPPKQMLPEFGLGGIIVSSDGKPFVCGYLYFNPWISFIEWIMSDPDYKGQDKDEGIDICIRALEMLAKKAGSRSTFTVTQNPSLIKRMKKLGYSVDENNSHECIKLI